MNEDKPFIIGLPIGVTIKVYKINSEEAQEILKRYPMNPDLGSIVVITGLSTFEAARYSQQISSEINRQLGYEK